MYIIFNNPDGTCGIITPSPKATVKYLDNKVVKERPMTIEEIAAKDVPEGCAWHIIEEIPNDTTYRNAWFNNEGVIDINIEKAKDIHLENIRNARAEKFISLGFPYKLDSDLEAAIIPKEKRDILQALRDISQNLDLSDITTVEELKNTWPEGL